MCEYVYRCANVYVNVCTYVYVRLRLNTRMQYKSSLTHMHTLSLSHTHIHIYIYKYTPGIVVRSRFHHIRPRGIQQRRVVFLLE
jgi:hypothetical protein